MSQIVNFHSADFGLQSTIHFGYTIATLTAISFTDERILEHVEAHKSTRYTVRAAE